MEFFINHNRLDPNPLLKTITIFDNAHGMKLFKTRQLCLDPLVVEWLDEYTDGWYQYSNIDWHRGVVGHDIISFSVRKGMTIVIPDQEIATLFKLTWL